MCKKSTFFDFNMYLTTTNFSLYRLLMNRVDTCGKKIVNKSKTQLKILHLLLVISETSMPYNEFALAMSDRQGITVCTYFPSGIKTPSQVFVIEGDGTFFGFFKALGSALKIKKHDIVHVHSPHLGVLFLIANMFYRQAIHKVCTVHNSYHNFKVRNRLLFIPVFSFFNRTICCSKVSLASFPGFYKWLAGKRLVAIPNGVDINRIDRYVSSSDLREKRREFVVVFLGRLINIKNPLVALDAFSKSNIPGKMIFIGDGRLRVQLNEKINKSSLKEKVKLLGLIPRKDVFRYLGEASVLISTSKGEGLPVAVLEAMVSRRPVVLSDIPPHREIAEGIDFIPLVEPEDTDGFASEIRRFQTMTSFERVQIGKKCRALVEKSFSLTMMHQRYEEVYLQVLGKNT